LLSTFFAKRYAGQLTGEYSCIVSDRVGMP